MNSDEIKLLLKIKEVTADKATAQQADLLDTVSLADLPGIVRKLTDAGLLTCNKQVSKMRDNAGDWLATSNIRLTTAGVAAAANSALPGQE